MQITTSIEISRGEELITVEATGKFEMTGSYNPNECGLSLSMYEIEPQIELSVDEVDCLVDRLYEEARS